MFPEDERIRNKFIGVNSEIKLFNGQKANFINFDNAATTPAFKKAAQYLNNFLPWYGSVGRGAGYKSQISTDLFEGSRKKILEFFSLKNRDDYEVIYVKNTTEGINKLASRLITSADDLVITTRMEHHSNDLPWRGKCKLEYIDVDEYGKISLDDLEEKLIANMDRFKFLAITGASNVTGYINPINKIARLVHRYGGRIIVDGAQLVPHRRINMSGVRSGEEIDYLVFSAHKIYAPFGVGVIIGKKDGLINGEPDLKGGGTVELVTDDKVIWKDNEGKDEAGTPNILGIAALLGALEEVDAIGYETIERREEVLLKNLFEGLRNIKRVRVYGVPIVQKDRLGIGVFNINGINHTELSQLLSTLSGISTRNGCFCAQPYVQRLLGIPKSEIQKHLENPKMIKDGMVRVSFGVYNTLDELWTFLNTMEYISKKY
ncbi:aminotransferase class V-fold PLP-dependent enzyme [Clostridium paridis]|uniref:Aminotransferase class V-fold PLP-dependent enzyme n=1 Tax=Clostridium paridis TaxID=2803863 RepID=A0A937K5K1_9CLOT|nr:aminotransferase class V-fold PLP-dependent enzyme [Clostridium paridis]MBL4932445.1 aminotransferase class V-fold PLP-dependent enzyme [Clostridium paridis]